jgi:hypothetical protein
MLFEENGFLDEFERNGDMMLEKKEQEVDVKECQKEC